MLHKYRIDANELLFVDQYPSHSLSLNSTLILIAYPNLSGTFHIV